MQIKKEDYFIAVKKLIHVKKLLIIITLFVFSIPYYAKAQQADTAIVLSGNCRWDSAGSKLKKYLINKKGFVYSRFGTLIINIKGKAYQPCNLPPALEGRHVLISAIVYRHRKEDGTPVKLTSLQILTE